MKDAGIAFGIGIALHPVVILTMSACDHSKPLRADSCNLIEDGESLVLALLDLPAELLDCILLKLPPRALRSVSLVNRFIRERVTSSQFLQDYSMAQILPEERTHSTSNARGKLFRRDLSYSMLHPNSPDPNHKVVTTLSWQDIMNLSKPLDNKLYRTFLPHLNALLAGGTNGTLNIRAPDLNYVGAISQHLQENDVDRCIGNIISRIELHAEHLSIRFREAPQYVAALIRHCPNLQELFVADDMIDARCIVDALSACTALRNMQWSLVKNSEFDQTDIIRCHRGWPAMQRVELQTGDKKKITAAVVREIINASPNLKILRVTYAGFDEACLQALPTTMERLVLWGASTQGNAGGYGQDMDRVRLSGAALVAALQRAPAMTIYYEHFARLPTQDDGVLARLETNIYAARYLD